MSNKKGKKDDTDYSKLSPQEAEDKIDEKTWRCEEPKKKKK